MGVTSRLARARARLAELERRELLLGAGRLHERRIVLDGRRGWQNLQTLDYNADHRPDVLHDLEKLPYPFDDDSFDEVHAYEVLEHTGQQGDWRFFFAQFSELWRVLKPGGYLAATCPDYRSMWALGDPSHKRVLCSGSLVFLDQLQYRQQIDGEPRPDGTIQRTAMSDFRFCYSADFTPACREAWREDGSNFVFVLRAVKPSRFRPTSAHGGPPP